MSLHQKILIVSYYELKECLAHAAKALIAQGFIVDNYPLFQYAHDKYDKKENYREHFLEHLQYSQPDIVLWWFFQIPTDVIDYITKNYPSYHILYGRNDIWIWNDSSLDMIQKTKYFDLIITSTQDHIQKYTEYGAKNVVYLTPSVEPFAKDEEIVLTEDEVAKYSCDVNFCCTNLYDETKYQEQFIPRKQLLDAIYQDPDIKLHVYGPDFLRELYPDSYCGYASHLELHKIFLASKISLSLHISCLKSGYLNKRSLLILSAGGLLLIDPVKDLNILLEPERDCLVLKPLSGQKIENQIKEILSNYEKYQPIREYGKKTSYLYDWKSWVWNILEILQKPEVNEIIISRKQKRPQVEIRKTNDQQIIYKDKLSLQHFLFKVQEAQTQEDCDKYWNKINKVYQQHPYLDINRVIAEIADL